MERKTDLRIVKTKKAIKTAFLNLLKENKYHNITISAISETALINRKTFYAHYETKDELYADVIEDALRVLSPANVLNEIGTVQYILLHTFPLDRRRFPRPNATYGNDNSYIFKRVFRIFRTFVKKYLSLRNLAFVKGIFIKITIYLPLKWCKLIYKIIYPVCVKQATMCFPKRNRFLSWVIIFKIVFRNFRI